MKLTFTTKDVTHITTQLKQHGPPSLRKLLTIDVDEIVEAVLAEIEIEATPERF